MAAFHGTDVEVPATLLIDGREVGEVGVSYRGNTSFDMPAKKSFGISIDAYDDDLRIDGHRTLNLLNANGDASMMREVLFSNIAGEYVPAPKANFVRVVVNGVYVGVYANVEQINKDFTKHHHGTRKGVRWKVPPDFSGGGALAYHGSDRDDYTGRYELKTGSAGLEDWDALIELCRVLRETPD
jgi:spore coat protein CotH